MWSLRCSRAGLSASGESGLLWRGGQPRNAAAPRGRPWWRGTCRWRGTCWFRLGPHSRGFPDRCSRPAATWGSTQPSPLASALRPLPLSGLSPHRVSAGKTTSKKCWFFFFLKLGILSVLAPPPPGRRTRLRAGWSVGGGADLPSPSRSSFLRRAAAGACQSRFREPRRGVCATAASARAGNNPGKTKNHKKEQKKRKPHKNKHFTVCTR